MHELSSQIAASFQGSSPDALIVFLSPKYDYATALKVLKEETKAKLIVGCSSAGEFTNENQGEGGASALALSSTEMKFSAVMAESIGSHPKEAATQMLQGFHGRENNQYLFKSALILTDALTGYVDELVEQINLLTGGDYRFFGGGAGDDARFAKTHVFCNEKVATNAAVALEILSNQPIGIGVRHGWTPASKAYRVTDSDGMKLISLNATPAATIYEDFARESGQKFDRTNPIPFFLHNIVGIKTEAGYKLRVPLAINADGSLSCAAEVPVGSIVHIMTASSASSADAAKDATVDAMSQLDGRKPGAALFFDCVATRLRMGKEFGMEMTALRNILDPAKYAGCNTYGQIARSEGQFSGFHNCTAVVCIFPE